VGALLVARGNDRHAAGDFAAIGLDELRKWWDAELTEQLIEGLRKAGLEIASSERKVGRAPAAATNRNTP
jgi:hypothetical protein